MNRIQLSQKQIDLFNQAPDTQLLPAKTSPADVNGSRQYCEWTAENTPLNVSGEDNCQSRASCRRLCGRAWERRAAWLCAAAGHAQRLRGKGLRVTARPLRGGPGRMREGQPAGEAGTLWSRVSCRNCGAGMSLSGYSVATRCSRTNPADSAGGRQQLLWMCIEITGSFSRDFCKISLRHLTPSYQNKTFSFLTIGCIQVFW